MSRRSDAGVNENSCTDMKMNLIDPLRALRGMKKCDISERKRQTYVHDTLHCIPCHLQLIALQVENVAFASRQRTEFART